jgi:hypothetical protein
MADAAPSSLGAWSSFYVMTGSAAAALTGLMFIVITLMTVRELRRDAHDGIAAFSTPTVIHFCAVLLVSAIFVAPWRSLGPAGGAVGIIGLYGIIYVLRAILRARRLSTYTADLEDWTWYTIAPLVAYGGICVGAISLAALPERALFEVAGAVVLLIFVGIRNAWDLVTYIVISLR